MKEMLRIVALVSAAMLLTAPVGAEIIGDGGKRWAIPAETIRHAAEREPVVAEVHFTGTQKIPVEKLLPFIKTRPGREYSQITVQDDLMRLAESRLCRPIAVRTALTDDGRVIVIFEVRDFANTVRDVIFHHAKHVSVKGLEELTGLRRGMPLDANRNMIACHEIAGYLKENGYHFANVTLEEGWHKSHERVVINITEGPKVRLGAVRFVGTNKFARADLLAQIESRPAPLAFSGPFGVGPTGGFQPSVIEADVVRLTNYFCGMGYLDVKVARELRFSDDLKFADITFRIVEGVRYKFAECRVESTCTDLPADLLFLLILTKKGEYYSEAAVQEDFGAIQGYVNDCGYDVRVTRHLTFDMKNPGLARVHFCVEDRWPRGFTLEIAAPVVVPPVAPPVILLSPGSLPPAIDDLLRKINFESAPPAIDR